jgi:hypothetical protein
MKSESAERHASGDFNQGGSDEFLSQNRLSFAFGVFSGICDSTTGSGIRPTSAKATTF